MLPVACVFPLAAVQSNRRDDTGTKLASKSPLSEQQWAALARALGHARVRTLCVATATAPVTHAPNVLRSAVMQCCSVCTVGLAPVSRGHVLASSLHVRGLHAVVMGAWSMEMTCV